MDKKKIIELKKKFEDLLSKEPKNEGVRNINLINKYDLIDLCNSINIKGTKPPTTMPKPLVLYLDLKLKQCSLPLRGQ